MAWLKRRLLALAVLLVLAVLLAVLGGISLFGIHHGYDVWGKLAMSAGWLLLSALFVLGAVLLMIGLRDGGRHISRSLPWYLQRLASCTGGCGFQKRNPMRLPACLQALLGQARPSLPS